MWNVTLSFGLIAVAASFAVVAIPQDDRPRSPQLQIWAGNTPVREPLNIDPVKHGELLVRRNGCLGCHSTDGTARIGPSFRGLFGREARFADGTSGIVDEAYLRESILSPAAKVVDGFAPGMPSFRQPLTDRQVEWIVDYLRTLEPVGAVPADPSNSLLRD